MLRLKNNPLKIFLSHIDAWGVTLIAVATVLLIHDAFSAENIYLLFALTLGAWLAFALNDYYDADYDAHDAVKAERNFFVNRPNSRPIIITGFILSLAIIFPAFAQFGWVGLGVLGMGLFAMWAYSAPPLRLKSRPILDLITHATFVETFPVAASLILIDAVWSPLDYVLVVIAMLSSLTAQLEQQTRDFAVDSATDCNFTTHFGLPTTQRLLRIFTATLLIFGIYHTVIGTIPPFLVPLAICAMPMLLRRFTATKYAPKSQRLSHRLTMFAVAYTIVLLAIFHLPFISL